MSKFTVRFLTRAHCPICDEARPIVTKAVARSGGTVEEIDVDGADDLREMYGDRIPVLISESGSVLVEGRFEMRDLRRNLRRLRRRL